MKMNEVELLMNKDKSVLIRDNRDKLCLGLEVNVNHLNQNLSAHFQKNIMYKQCKYNYV